MDFRVRQLENLLRLYEENEVDLITALYKDLRKPKPEAKLFEIEVLKTDVRTMIDNCKEWAKPQRVFCFVVFHYHHPHLQRLYMDSDQNQLLNLQRVTIIMKEIVVCWCSNYF